MQNQILQDNTMCTIDNIEDANQNGENQTVNINQTTTNTLMFNTSKQLLETQQEDVREYGQMGADRNSDVN